MKEELKIIISAEIDKLKKATLDAKKAVDDFTKDADKGASNMDAAFKKMGDGVKSAASAIGKGIAAIGAALVGVGVATQEYQANQAKLTAAFETVGASAETAKNTYNDLYRALGDSDKATEAANHLAKLTTNEKELSEWTTICQGVYATFGDSIPIEGLTEAANETAKTGALTGSLADALNWCGISEEQFQEKLDACTTEQEREKLIRETLNKSYKEAAANYEKTAADVLAQNEAQAKLQETLAKVGAVMTPIITAFTQFGSEALAIVAPYIQQLAQDLLPTLKTILEGIIDAMKVAFDWVSKHKEVLAAVAIAVGVVATAIGLYNAVAAVKAAMAAAEVVSVWALVAAYAAQAAAMLVAIAPYVAIVAAIAAVVAAIVLCVKNWDTIKEKTKEVWSKMVETVKNGTEKVANFFKKIFSWIKDNWQGLLLLIVNPFAGAFKLAYDNCESFRNKVNSIFTSIKDGIKSRLEIAKNVVSSAIEKIKGFFNFKWSLPKLKMPHIKISGEFSILPPKVPKFSIDWYAQGGVFDKPTLFNYSGGIGGLGESGAEAIVPLENNTKWLDRLATMLNEKQGGGSIVLQVDGKTFAQTSIDSINALTKQKGKLGLNLI